MAISVLLIFSSCATVMTGGTKKVRVKDVPERATVYYNGQALKKTTAKVSRKDPGVITVKQKGCEDQVIDLDRKISVGYIVADVCFGVVPLLIDLATGAIYKPTYSKIHYRPECDTQDSTSSQ